VSRNLVIFVQLYDQRFHGAGEWAPSPARLFQALVAAASRGAMLDPDARAALKWLQENPHAPVIALPRMAFGQPLSFFGRDNDLDALGNDPARVAEIRSEKRVQPRLLEGKGEFVYAWPLPEGQPHSKHAEAVRILTKRLYQYGRGVDMAWARAEIMDDGQFEAILARHVGLILRPSPTGRRTLACPRPGSIESLEARYDATRRRLQASEDRELFRQPPKPRFAQVAYDSPPSRRVYDLRETGREARLFVQRVSRAFDLIVWIRDEAARKLRSALPASHDAIERAAIGRKADGADDAPTAQRIRIIPLPSIGHLHADRGIRRVVVEVPSTCLLRADDVHWAISGIERGGEFVVSPSADERMLSHFTDAARTWRTVTPVALPESAARRRIEPSRMAHEAKGGSERAAEEAKAAAAVIQALRHADVRTTPQAIRVQREPFDLLGERAEAFAGGTRFAKERLWHVEVAFEAPVSGPLVIGDGRFLGLGVMAPLAATTGVHILAIESGLIGAPDPEHIAQALRRAVMARVQAVLRDRPLPAYFSGHDPGGGPARAEMSSHLAFQYDLPRSRLLIVAPHAIDRRDPTREERDQLAVLDDALQGMRELRAGPAGCLVLRRTWIDVDLDPLTGLSRTWESVTSYVVTRHAHLRDASVALATDIAAECRRRGLPQPNVKVQAVQSRAGVGLAGRVKLIFPVAAIGPIVLGKTRYMGGGLFARMNQNGSDDGEENSASAAVV
jgi:CRISPR-associated protein Csb2